MLGGGGVEIPYRKGHFGQRACADSLPIEKCRRFDMVQWRRLAQVQCAVAAMWAVIIITVTTFISHMSEFLCACI